MTVSEKDLLDGFSSHIMGLAEMLDYAEAIDFEDDHSRQEFANVLLKFSECMEGGKYSFHRVISVLGQLDTDGDYGNMLYRLYDVADDTYDIVTMNSATAFKLAPGTNNIELVTDRDAFDALATKYVTVDDGVASLKDGAEFSTEDTQYAIQVMELIDNLGASVFGPLCSVIADVQ